jgi:hypothetical protein
MQRVGFGATDDPLLDPNRYNDSTETWIPQILPIVYAVDLLDNDEEVSALVLPTL